MQPFTPRALKTSRQSAQRSVFDVFEFVMKHFFRVLDTTWTKKFDGAIKDAETKKECFVRYSNTSPRIISVLSGSWIIRKFEKWIVFNVPAYEDQNHTDAYENPLSENWFNFFSRWIFVGDTFCCRVLVIYKLGKCCAEKSKENRSARSS